MGPTEPEKNRGGGIPLHCIDRFEKDFNRGYEQGVRDALRILRERENTLRNVGIRSHELERAVLEIKQKLLPKKGAKK
jgi:hypothetical protein